MRQIINTLLLIPVLLVFACSGEGGPVASDTGDNPSPAGTEWLAETPPATEPPTGLELPESLSPRDQIIRNCWIVQAAAEAFAAENNGQYPGNLAEETPSGNSLIDLLPDGVRLVNPIWDARVNPIDGAAAQQGETGYVVIVRNGLNTGYAITGCGPEYKWEFYIVRDEDGSLTSWVRRLR
jgi:hypothetical protein